MHFGHRTFALLIALGAVTTPTAAFADFHDDDPPFTSLTVFGDSLVDAGNVYAVTGGAIPSATEGYFQGRFTNGYAYTDLLSIDLFGTPTVPSALGGTNFAFGGAQANTGTQVPDLQEQLALYAASGQTIDPTGLYVLNFGGNDVRTALAPGAPAGFESDEVFLAQAAAIYADGIQTLSDLGAQNFLITGFPIPVELSALGDVFLTAELASLDLDLGTDLFFYSYLDFYERLLEDPTAFGLPSDLNITTSCQAAGALPDCTGFVYFDNIHPTAAIHEAAYLDMNNLFGLATTPVPEPSTWMMLLIGFGAVGCAIRGNKRCAASTHLEGRVPSA